VVPDTETTVVVNAILAFSQTVSHANTTAGKNRRHLSRGMAVSLSLRSGSASASG
jgi:hypothetical protein